MRQATLRRRVQHCRPKLASTRDAPQSRRCPPKCQRSLGLAIGFLGGLGTSSPGTCPSPLAFDSQFALELGTARSDLIEGIPLHLQIVRRQVQEPLFAREHHHAARSETASGYHLYSSNGKLAVPDGGVGFSLAANRALEPESDHEGGSGLCGGGDSLVPVVSVTRSGAPFKP